MRRKSASEERAETVNAGSGVGSHVDRKSAATVGVKRQHALPIVARGCFFENEVKNSVPAIVWVEAA